MTVEEIVNIVRAGITVHIGSALYVVEESKSGEFYIRCTANNHMVGLTGRDETRLNYKPSEAFICITTYVLGVLPTGEAGIAGFRVYCRHDQYASGDHYGAAINVAEESLDMDVAPDHAAEGTSAFDSTEPAATWLRKDMPLQQIDIRNQALAT